MGVLAVRRPTWPSFASLLPYYLTALLPYTLPPYHLTTLLPYLLTTYLTPSLPSLPPRYAGPVAQLRVLLGSEDKATFSAVS